MFQQLLLRPDEYSVIATPNLNGDYLSDAAAAQVGGLGIAPGGNVGDGVAVFEATHGTAPKYANLDKINPGSVILSGVMMFEYMGWNEAAQLIVKGVENAIKAKRVTYDLARQMPGATEVSTSAFGDADHRRHGRLTVARNRTACRSRAPRTPIAALSRRRCSRSRWTKPRCRDAGALDRVSRRRVWRERSSAATFAARATRRCCSRERRVARSACCSSAWARPPIAGALRRAAAIAARRKRNRLGVGRSRSGRRLSRATLEAAAIGLSPARGNTRRPEDAAARRRAAARRSPSHDPRGDNRRTMRKGVRARRRHRRRAFARAHARDDAGQPLHAGLSRRTPRAKSPSVTA